VKVDKNKDFYKLYATLEGFTIYYLFNRYSLEATVLYYRHFIVLPSS